MKLVGKNSNIVCCRYIQCTTLYRELENQASQSFKNHPKRSLALFQTGNFSNPSNRFREKFIELHRGIFLFSSFQLQCTAVSLRITFTASMHFWKYHTKQGAPRKFLIASYFIFLFWMSDYTFSHVLESEYCSHIVPYKAKNANPLPSHPD